MVRSRALCRVSPIPETAQEPVMLRIHAFAILLALTLLPACGGPFLVFPGGAVGSDDLVAPDFHFTSLSRAGDLRLSEVPEPSTVAMLYTGLVGFGFALALFLALSPSCARSARQGSLSDWDDAWGRKWNRVTQAISPTWPPFSPPSSNVSRGSSSHSS